VRHELSRIRKGIVQPLRPPGIPLWRRLMIFIIVTHVERDGLYNYSPSTSIGATDGTGLLFILS
jgi:hypothetical protein